jgi:hypothetical protein
MRKRLSEWHKVNLDGCPCNALGGMTDSVPGRLAENPEPTVPIRAVRKLCRPIIERVELDIGRDLSPYSEA